MSDMDDWTVFIYLFLFLLMCCFLNRGECVCVCVGGGGECVRACVRACVCVFRALQTRQEPLSNLALLEDNVHKTPLVTAQRDTIQISLGIDCLPWPVWRLHSQVGTAATQAVRSSSTARIELLSVNSGGHQPDLGF